MTATHVDEDATAYDPTGSEIALASSGSLHWQIAYQVSLQLGRGGTGLSLIILRNKREWGMTTDKKVSTARSVVETGASTSHFETTLDRHA